MAPNSKDVIAEKCAEILGELASGRVSAELAAEQLNRLARPWIIPDIRAKYRFVDPVDSLEELFNLFLHKTLRLAGTINKALTQSGTPPRAYLWRIADNIAKDLVNAERRRATVFVPSDDPYDSVPSQTPSAERELEVATLRQKLPAVFGHLPFDLRVAVVLSTMEGMSVPDLAWSTMSSVEQARSRKSKGERLLKRLVREGTVALDDAS